MKKTNTINRSSRSMVDEPIVVDRVAKTAKGNNTRQAESGSQQTRLAMFFAKIKSAFPSGRKQVRMPVPQLGIYAVRWNRLQGFSREQVIGQLPRLLHPMLPWRQIEVPPEIPDECIGFLSLWGEGRPILRAGLTLREGECGEKILVLTKLFQ